MFAGIFLNLLLANIFFPNSVSAQPTYLLIIKEIEAVKTGADGYFSSDDTYIAIDRQLIWGGDRDFDDGTKYRVNKSYEFSDTIVVDLFDKDEPFSFETGMEAGAGGGSVGSSFTIPIRRDDDYLGSFEVSSITDGITKARVSNRSKGTEYIVYYEVVQEESKSSSSSNNLGYNSELMVEEAYTLIIEKIQAISVGADCLNRYACSSYEDETYMTINGDRVWGIESFEAGDTKYVNREFPINNGMTRVQLFDSDAVSDAYGGRVGSVTNRLGTAAKYGQTNYSQDDSLGVFNVLPPFTGTPDVARVSGNGSTYDIYYKVIKK